MNNTKTHLFTLFLFLITTAAAIAQPVSGISGKRYVAKTAEACKDKTTGGCMLYTYCAMEFKDDSVCIYYYQNAICSVKSEEAGYNLSLYNERKTYRWKATHDTVLIPGFELYGTCFVLRDKQLISRMQNINILAFDEDEIYSIVQQNALQPFSISRYGPSVNIRTVLADTAVKKCDKPSVAKLIGEIIAANSSNPAGSVIDPDAKYMECYKTTYAWSSYAGIMQKNDFCAERVYQPVKGKKLKQKFTEKEQYDSNSFPMSATRIYSFGRFLVIDDLLVHVGNATESGITVTHYYEKK